MRRSTVSPSRPRKASVRPTPTPSARWTPAWPRRRFRRIDRPGIDALMVPGGNFPTMDWIAAWEREFGKLVFTTNRAALWAVLQTMKIATPLASQGRLLEQLPAG